MASYDDQDLRNVVDCIKLYRVRAGLPRPSSDHIEEIICRRLACGVLVWGRQKDQDVMRLEAGDLYKTAIENQHLARHYAYL